jgi:hypothetical protein
LDFLSSLFLCDRIARGLIWGNLLPQLEPNFISEYLTTTTSNTYPKVFVYPEYTSSLIHRPTEIRV